MGIFKPKAYFWAGGENKEIIYILELLDKVPNLCFKISIWQKEKKSQKSIA